MCITSILSIILGLPHFTLVRQPRGFYLLYGRYVFFLNDSKKNEIKNKQRGGDPENGMYFLDLFLAYLCNAVEDKAGCDTVRNAVAERHEHACKEGGNGLGEIAPVYFLERGGHHYTDDYQRGSGGGEGYGADKGCKESAYRKADGNDYAGETGASARADSGCAFNICGGVGGTEDSAYRGCGGVGKQRLIHLGFEAGAGLHGLLVLGAEYAGTAAGADEGAYGVKGVGDAESKYRNENLRDS